MGLIVTEVGVIVMFFYGDGDVVVCLKDVLSVGDEDGKLITGLVFREDGL